MAAMRGPRACRPEPAEPAVVAVVRGERAVRAVVQDDVVAARAARLCAVVGTLGVMGTRVMAQSQPGVTPEQLAGFEAKLGVTTSAGA